MPAADCPACRFDRRMSDDYRREPAESDEGAYGFSWVQGAAHVMALIVQGKPVALSLCDVHRDELTEQIVDDTGRPCLDMSQTINLGCEGPAFLVKT